jgi:hypothetical protein
LTAGLAYQTAAESSWGRLGEGESAIEHIAVTWAVLQFSASMPASIEDQAAIAEATRHTLELAATLGASESDLREALRRCTTGLADVGGRDPCGANASA